MKVRTILLALGIGTLLAVTPAHADGSSSKDQCDSTFIVKVGAFSANGNNLVDNGFLSDNGLLYGVEYEWGHKGSNQRWSVTADFAQVDANFNTTIQNNGVTTSFTTQTDETVIPVMVNYKWYSGNSGDRSRLYAGIGLGTFLGNFSGFGYQGMLGYQFSKHWEVEARYLVDSGNTVVGNSQLNNIFGASVGYRF
ncbi:MAG: hypothetical protein ACYCW6_14005 [Candidatus Xenobia bacterium]